MYGGSLILEFMSSVCMSIRWIQLHSTPQTSIMSAILEAREGSVLAPSQELGLKSSSALIDSHAFSNILVCWSTQCLLCGIKDQTCFWYGGFFSSKQPEKWKLELSSESGWVHLISKEKTSTHNINKYYLPLNLT